MDVHDVVHPPPRSAEHASPPMDFQRPVSVLEADRRRADAAVDLTGRVARCAYYGRARRDGKPCTGETPSAASLDFFKQLGGPHDEYYCGCWGWD